MFTVKAFVGDQEYTIHNPKVKALTLGSPYYQKGDNVNGQAEFTVYPTHPYYKYVQKLTTDIVFYKDGVEKFAGRVLYDDEDSAGSKKVFVEGELAYFNDSIQRPKVYHNCSVRAYLQDLIDIHNSQVEERKQFVLGRVTVTDSNDSLYRYSNWENTRTILKEKLTSRLGGHLVIRKENGLRILDYLNDDDFYKKNSQTIRFGKNLLDFSRNIDASDLATCIIPLGAKLEEEDQDESLEAIKEQRLTIESVNGGVDYVTDDNAVATYGRIQKTVTWDDVTVPQNLLTKAREYLTSTQFEKMVLELKAIDMNLADDTVEEFEIGSMVRCISEPNGLDREFPVSELKIYLTEFAKNTITLGEDTENRTYTSSNQHRSEEMEQVINSIPSKSEILQEAIRDAQELINAQVASGHAIHEPNEFVVADDVDYKNQARNLWRWGLGGLAHYSEGYDGPIDGIALTMDGKINGKMILANSITAESIDIGYRNSVETTITKTAWAAQSNAEKAAKEYADGIEEAMREEIDDVTDTLGDLDKQVEYIASDGIITEAEKAAINKILQTVEKEKKESDTKYNDLHSNAYLSGTPKTNLKSKYDALYGSASASKYNDLITKINNVINATTASQVNTRMTAYRTSYSAYSQVLADYLLAIEDATNAIANEYAKEQASMAQENAQDYADQTVKVAKETIETSITNLENRIALSVTSTKEIASRRNYVVNGEHETLAKSSFTVSGTAATVSEAEFLNTNCLKVQFTATGLITINQSLGTLEAGNYTISAEAGYPDGTAQRPSYIRYGFSGNQATTYFSSYAKDEFHSFKRTVKITKAAKTVSISVYGSSGDICYITNIRCLRDIQELIDDLDARLEVEIGSVTATVSDLYENTQHNYCTNGSFSNTSNYFQDWYRNNTTYVTRTTLSSKSCAKISNPSTTLYYLRQTYKIGRAGTFKVRFKAACASGDQSKARIRCTFNGTAKYTTAGELTTSFKTFEFDYTVSTTGTKYLYLYNNVAQTDVYITDVEVLGYITGYSESQLSVLQDSITAEVERAQGAEDELSASIKVNADNITNTVKKGDFASYLRQYYNTVIVAFNNSSKYVQISAGRIEIYDYGVTTSKKRASFDQNGNHFWRDGYEVGWIGTNYYSGDRSKRGLSFDLEYEGAYMTFSAKKTANASTYSMFWTYALKTVGSYTAGKLHAGCDIDMHGWKLINPSFEDGGITQTIRYVQVLQMNSDGTVQRWGANGMMRFKNGILVDLTYYT